ncbi:putative teichuronic acid biosynthesis glycosyltransferase TuaC [Streptomyces sp. RB5]|uniref:Putative teichuronic acid biosynthesis glycosyltransferase TuaC n=1 Tax=Streptomyces smaragdinus TaxID=2585196 RepID=A0A7K0CHH7_9ACTN|nr:glycosyltransferase family 4 protein [Streptomyces smaragdinus]MQY12763.1 putative teichuronic acid biosynthesis glycosyltransferase TuaC [Streptomyces smaragdinus]
MSHPAGSPRVLLVSHYYPPHLGGIENVVRREAAGLAARGADVTVLTTGAVTSVTREEGVRVVRIAAWNGVERRTGVPFPFPSPRLLTAAVRRARAADVVHIHDCLYPTSWAAGLAAAVTRTPRVLTQHVALVRHPSALVRGVQRAVYAVAGRLLLRGARTVVTLNAGVAAFVARLGARSPVHLPNGVDTALFRPAADPGERPAGRRELGLPEDGVLVLFAGRLVPKKGYGLLLEAYRPDDGYRLVFAGDGAALDGDVHHLGTLTPERLALAYRACDVFALPSTAEGFPLTVQEAMASGLPVLTTDDPGYAPYRLDGDLVRLVPRRPDALREALAELAGDASLRAGMAAYSRKYSEEHFDWGDHVTALLRIYRDAR